METTITTKIDIPESVLIGVLTTALEGGINYWGYVLDYRRDDEHMITWAVIQEEEPEDAAKTFHLDAAKILEGVTTLHGLIGTGERDVHPNSEIGSQFLFHLFANQEDDGLDLLDSVASEAIVQAACFGEIRYG